MRKTLLMMSAALVTVFLSGAASAGPFNDQIKNGNPPASAGTAGKISKGGVGKSTADKISTGGLGKPVSPPPLGTPIPAPSTGPKLGPYDKISNPPMTPTPTPSKGPKLGPYDKISNPPIVPSTKKPTTPGGGPGGGGTGGGTGGGSAGGGMGGGKGGHGHHHPHWPVFGFGFGAAPSVEYVPVYQTAPVYQPAPVYGESQAIYGQPAQVAAPQPVPIVVNPFDDVVGRLNQLNAAISQGLITQNEYRTQRPAILAALDAGQVSRSIGIQEGLRRLKAMADSGFISGKEYDDKRREFALFI